MTHRAYRTNIINCATTIVGVALITGLVHLIPGADHITNISLLYLLVVIAAAYRFGSGPAVLASLLGVLSFDWFFIEPRYTFTADNPAEWLALAVFLVTAIVISQLTATLRLRVEEAHQRERETTVLAEASWAVASQVSHQQTLVEVLRRMTDVTGSDAAAIVVESDGRPHIVASHAKQPALLDFAHLMKALRFPLMLEQRVVGTLHLHLQDGQTLNPSQRRVVESLTNHAAAALERHRLAQAEAQAQALAEADRLKTAGRRIRRRYAHFARPHRQSPQQNRADSGAAPLPAHRAAHRLSLPRGLTFIPRKNRLPSRKGRD